MPRSPRGVLAPKACKLIPCRQGERPLPGTLAIFTLGLAMCSFLRTKTIVGIVALTLLSSQCVLAACAPGSENCGPSVDDARAKIEQLLDSAFVTPHRLTSLEQFDGRLLGAKKFEMRVLAVLNYSGDALECRINGCPELHNYLVEVDGRAKKATVAGWLFFEQTEQGWR